MRSLEVVNAFEGGSKHDRRRRQTQFYMHIRYAVHVQYVPKNFPFSVQWNDSLHSISVHDSFVIRYDPFVFCPISIQRPCALSVRFESILYSFHVRDRAFARGT